MDRESLEELFAPIGRVRVGKMFSGYGIYLDDLIFALCLDGEIYLKTDPETRPRFEAVNSQPFAYDGARGRVTTSYWQMPASAHDDEDELRAWSALALEASRRVQAAKAKPRRVKAPAAKPAGKSSGRKI